MALAQQAIEIELAGPDGNIFAILSKATKILLDEGKAMTAKEMQGRVFNSLSYETARGIIEEYVTVIYK
jgi:hypothetical protein